LLPVFARSKKRKSCEYITERGNHFINLKTGLILLGIAQGEAKSWGQAMLQTFSLSRRKT